MERSKGDRDIVVLKFKYSVLPEDPPDDCIPHKGTNNTFTNKQADERGIGVVIQWWLSSVGKSGQQERLLQYLPGRQHWGW